MGTKPMKFNKGKSSTINESAVYYFENDTSKFTDTHKSIYAEVMELERSRLMRLDDNSSDIQLDLISKEIKTRIKITQYEIFKIGELLCLAKRNCQKAGTGFQKWIEDNFDFSLKTANNFMNVFEQCMGIREIAMKLSPSILYEFSAPSFPEELKEYLLTEGNLEKITHGKFKELTRKYKEGGIEAIKNDMGQIDYNYKIFQQTQFTFTMFNKALGALEELAEKILGNFYHEELFPEHMHPEASEIVTKLTTALNNSIGELNSAIQESKVLLDKYDKDIKTMLQ